eukprot:6212256-Pleurochrysis_carterae.AAC.4
MGSWTLPATRHEPSNTSTRQDPRPTSMRHRAGLSVKAKLEKGKMTQDLGMECLAMWASVQEQMPQHDCCVRTKRVQAIGGSDHDSRGA